MALTVNFALICLIGFLDGPWFLHYITLHSFSSTLFSLQEFSQTNMWVGGGLDFEVCICFGIYLTGTDLFWWGLTRKPS